MSSLRAGLLVGILVLAIPSWSQQTSQATTVPASDPQAVAVVQAAITALGGATAISQAQSWTFQAQMQGRYANGDVGYVMSTDTDTGLYLLADGTTKPAPATQSQSVPALVGAILLKESQDPNFSMLFSGTAIQDSKPVSVIVFIFGLLKFPAQIWTFDSANLPIQVDFRLPARIGARRSRHGLVVLSDYRSVGGVLYPFRIVSPVWGQLSQIVTLQLVASGATAPTNEFNGPAGDLP
jgi:hypothetical protein